LADEHTAVADDAARPAGLVSRPAEDATHDRAPSGAGIGSPSPGGRGHPSTPHRAVVPVKRRAAAARYLPVSILLRNRLQRAPGCRDPGRGLFRFVCSIRRLPADDSGWPG
jgi:hypothetical protein